MSYRLTDNDLEYYRSLGDQRIAKNKLALAVAAEAARKWRADHGAVCREDRIGQASVETKEALNAAMGDRGKAAAALGITKAALHLRITAWGLADWLAKRWPAYEARSREVVGVSYEGVGYARMRVYQVRCGTEIHVKRVPAVGVERKRVVCEVCKEARTK